MKKSQEVIEDGSIMAGLVLLAMVTPPGGRWTQADIAFVCGCNPNYIQALEREALKKIRRGFIKYFRERKVLGTMDSESEIARKIWAVIGPDRVVATDVTYDAAVEITNSYSESDNYAFAVVTAEAARRLAPATPETNGEALLEV